MAESDTCFRLNLKPRHECLCNCIEICYKQLCPVMMIYFRNPLLVNDFLFWWSFTRARLSIKLSRVLRKVQAKIFFLHILLTRSKLRSLERTKRELFECAESRCYCLIVVYYYVINDRPKSEEKRCWLSGEDYMKLWTWSCKQLKSDETIVAYVKEQTASSLFWFLSFRG